MAAMNGPQFVSCMLRRKDRLDLTCTLQDLRQWPTLGQSSDSVEKKKATPSGNSSSNSTGKAASSSRIKGDVTGGSDERSSKAPATPSFTSVIPSSSSCDRAGPSSHNHHTDSSNSSSSHEDGASVGSDGLQRPNSVEFARKKGGKKYWKPCPFDIPALQQPSRQAIQEAIEEKLRIRREEFHGGAAYRSDNRFRPGPPPQPPASAPWTTNTASSKAAQPSGGGSNSNNSANSSSVANQPFRNNSVNGSVSAQTDQNRRFKKPPAPAAAAAGNSNLNRPRVARKVQGFRHRDMTFDGDYMGREGDGHSDAADDWDGASQYDQADHEGRYGGARNGGGVLDGGYNDGWTDWSATGYYDTYGADNSGGGGGYSQGYQNGDYSADGYTGYYTSGANGDVAGLDENGLYIPVSPMPAVFTPQQVAPSDGVELKEMIKYQIEYYFSPENLQKDFFLRRMMAKDGSVMLGLVASFQRVRALSQDFNLIIESIVDSQQVELMDNFMVRPRETPELWPIEEEDEKKTTYYYINGETDDDRAYQLAGGFDETDESGTGEDVASYPDEDEEEEEQVSMDGSELSGDMRRVMSLKPDDLRNINSMQAMSEKLLQQVM